jgi:hypothetical protein
MQRASAAALAYAEFVQRPADFEGDSASTIQADTKL